jgi:hypothetical protein
MDITAPKKTWSGQWVRQIFVFVANFVAGGLESDPNHPRFLSHKMLKTENPNDLLDL